MVERQLGNGHQVAVKVHGELGVPHSCLALYLEQIVQTLKRHGRGWLPSGPASHPAYLCKMCISSASNPGNPYLILQ